MALIDPVSPTELIRSSWGMAVRNELNTRTVKLTGTTESGGAITGPLTINASPALKLRRSDNLPTVYWESNTGTRYGYFQATATTMVYAVDSTATGAEHRFLVGGVEKVTIDATGIVVDAITTTSTITSNGKGRFGGNGSQLELIDTSTSGSDFHDCYVAFFGGGVSMVSPGTRTGYVGYGSSTTLQLHNEVANGGVALVGNGSGTISMTTGVSGDITSTTGAGGNIILNSNGIIALISGGSERGRVAGSLMWGKTTGGQATPGVELFESGCIYTTTANNSVPNMLMRHNTNADDVAYVQFANASGGILSEINQDNTAPVGIKISNCAVSAPSDYRLKNDLGPVTNAVARMMQLQPKHLSWKETGAQFDGFLAHEVAEVVPIAVTGEKDAVYEDPAEANRMGVPVGTIKPQQFTPEPLIPLLTAALQELVDRVTALEDAA